MNLPVKYQPSVVADDATDAEKALTSLAVEYLRNSKKPTLADTDEFWKDPEYLGAQRALRRSFPIK